MSMYPYTFTVVFYNDLNSDANTNHYKRESGMGLAESFSAAVKQLEQYYGDDLIAVKHLELFEENNIILLPEHVIEDYARADGYYCQAPDCDAFGNGNFVAVEREATNEC